MTALPRFRLRQVRRTYGTRTVLDIDALDILPGERLAIVGPSGAGKSTLLRLLNFLEAPDSGGLWFDGVPITFPPGPELGIRRQVTTLFQRPVMLARSVAANVVYGLQVRGIRDYAAVVADALARVGLTHLAHHPARTLSGGEMQRVALARALVLRPQALLLDEPTANLDPAQVTLIEQLVQEVNETQGTTLVLVTHNLFQARRLAHRTALLLDGCLVEVAPTATFFGAPADPRTRAFVQGEMIY